MSLDRTIKNPLEHPDTPEVDPKQFWNYVIELIGDDLDEHKRMHRKTGEYQDEINETKAYLDYAQEIKEK